MHTATEVQHCVQKHNGCATTLSEHVARPSNAIGGMSIISMLESNMLFTASIVTSSS